MGDVEGQEDRNGIGVGLSLSLFFLFLVESDGDGGNTCSGRVHALFRVFARARNMTAVTSA